MQEATDHFLPKRNWSRRIVLTNTSWYFQNINQLMLLPCSHDYQSCLRIKSKLLTVTPKAWHSLALAVSQMPSFWIQHSVPLAVPGHQSTLPSWCPLLLALYMALSFPHWGHCSDVTSLEKTYLSTLKLNPTCSNPSPHYFFSAHLPPPAKSRSISLFLCYHLPL